MHRTENNMLFIIRGFTFTFSSGWCFDVFFSLLEVKSSVNNKDCKEKKKMIFIFYTPFLIYMKIKLIVHKFNEVTQR